MADKQIALQRVIRDSTRDLRQARREFQKSLQSHMRQRLQEAGTSIEELVKYGKIRESLDRILLWYQQVKGTQTPLLAEALDQVSTERAEL